MFSTAQAPAPKVQIEAILCRMDGDIMQVMTDEGSKPVSLHKSGVKILFSGDTNKFGDLVTLTLSERKAINAGLV